MKILIIEDEKQLAESMATYLSGENYICEIASTLQEAREKTERFEYDCILLDIGLPDGNGLTILHDLKADKKEDCVLIISAKNSLDDRVAGLQLGADDYLGKPFHLPELSARIAAIIRRKNFKGNNQIVFFEIDLNTLLQTVSIHKKEMELTKKEYQLVLYFLINKGRVISKDAIATHLWGDEMDMTNNFDFIYTHIKNLRKKLADAGCGDYIKSVYGMGYRFTNS